MYPQACVDYVRENGKYIRKGAIVTDSSGIKRAICPQLRALSEEFGFVFVGSHPMAGKEKNGYEVSEAELYEGASFIITPCGADDESVKSRSRRSCRTSSHAPTSSARAARTITAFRQAATATFRASRTSIPSSGASCSSRTASR